MKNLICIISSLLSLSLLLLLLCPSPGYTQDTLPKNWYLLDLKEDDVFGMSVEKAYRELLNHKQPADTIIVAIIDTGVDPHEDLLLWHNTREKGNDEDRNGYRGDVHGWNFLGGKDGDFFKLDNLLEDVRVYFQLRDQYRDKSLREIPREKHREYLLWTKVKEKFQADSLGNADYRKSVMNRLLEGDCIIQKILGKEIYTHEDLKDLDLKDEAQYKTVELRAYLSGDKTNRQVIKEQQDRYATEMEEVFSYASYNEKAKRRQEIIGDNYKDFADRYYGNPEIKDIGGHGTHVAGIVGALRDNDIGIKGVANAVKIMPIRAVPFDGDEYDKDVALAIRYAVDNGAKVINMSFAKDFSPEQEWVEKAIRYAAWKDVLLINGAGNDGRSVDTVPKYPTSKYLGKNKRFPNMITVGASKHSKTDLIDRSSNYGKKMVDVFAPGVAIYSTYKNNTYFEMSGTSMASPMVAGLAALLRSYYPKLSSRQVKHIIEASVVKPETLVKMPALPTFHKKEEKWVSMDELCRTGGIVNAYKAVLLAESISNK